MFRVFRLLRKLIASTMSLSAQEISDIQSTWTIPIATPSESGKAILLAFFTRYPANLQKFRDFKDMTIEELKVGKFLFSFLNLLIYSQLITFNRFVQGSMLMLTESYLHSMQPSRL